MTQDRIGKSFTVIFTNGDLPDSPMSLRECAVCGGCSPVTIVIGLVTLFDIKSR